MRKSRPKTGPHPGLEAIEDFFVTPQERASLQAVDSGPGFGSPVAAGPDIRELMAFWVSDEQYGIGIDRLQEIIKVPEITPVPRVAAAVLGIISLRGTIVPLLDLRLALRLDHRPLSKHARILVVRAEEDWVGLAVDRVSSVVRLEEEEIGPPPFKTEEGVAELIEGVGRIEDQMIIILDVPAVLRTMEGTS